MTLMQAMPEISVTAVLRELGHGLWQWAMDISGWHERSDCERAINRFLRHDGGRYGYLPRRVLARNAALIEARQQAG